MSHKATNWAIQQRGLSPVTKLVLWYLCDRHNPDFGCFPSQDQLAADAEISRASLNVHLEKLEFAGLIRRQRRVDEVTRKQKSTRYVLGFEDDFGGEPCPESGHGKLQKPCPDSGKSRVQILDTNLVREPVTTTAHDAGASGDAEAACLAACGEGLTPAARAAITTTRLVINGLQQATTLPRTFCPRWPSGPSKCALTRSGHGRILPRRSRSAMPRGSRWRQGQKVLGKRER